MRGPGVSVVTHATVAVSTLYSAETGFYTGRAEKRLDDGRWVRAEEQSDDPERAQFLALAKLAQAGLALVPRKAVAG
jgi:hypothetical protein